MNINHLFPTPVGFFKLDREFTEDEKNYVLNQEKYPNMGNVTSSDRYIFDKPEMGALNTFVNECVKEYFQSVYSPKHEVETYITQSWANYTDPGQYHHKHEHPNSFISGVLYLQAEKESDRIYFYKNGYQQIKVPTENYNLYNSDSWWFEVNTGDVVLFPSHLTHMVETVKGDHTRISIAFNVFLKGYIGDESSLTALHLGAK